MALATASGLGKRFFPFSMIKASLFSLPNFLVHSNPSPISKPFAALIDASMLLVDRDSIPKETIDEINRLKPKKIYLIGEKSSIGNEVLEALNKNFNISYENKEYNNSISERLKTKGEDIVNQNVS